MSVARSTDAHERDPRWQWFVAISRSGLPTSTRAVLWAIRIFLDRDLRCWPSVELLADRTGLSEPSVRRHLRRAEQAGWIEATLRPGTSSVFRARFPASCHGDSSHGDSSHRRGAPPPPGDRTPPLTVIDEPSTEPSTEPRTGPDVCEADLRRAVDIEMASRARRAEAGQGKPIERPAAYARVVRRGLEHDPERVREILAAGVWSPPPPPQEDGEYLAALRVIVQAAHDHEKTGGLRHASVLPSFLDQAESGCVLSEAQRATAGRIASHFWEYFKPQTFGWNPRGLDAEETAVQRACSLLRSRAPTNGHQAAKPPQPSLPPGVERLAEGIGECEA